MPLPITSSDDLISAAKYDLNEIDDILKQKFVKFVFFIHFVKEDRRRNMRDELCQAINKAQSLKQSMQTEKNRLRLLLNEKEELKRNKKEAKENDNQIEIKRLQKELNIKDSEITGSEKNNTDFEFAIFKAISTFYNKYNKKIIEDDYLSRGEIKNFIKKTSLELKEYADNYLQKLKDNQHKYSSNLFNSKVKNRVLKIETSDLKQEVNLHRQQIEELFSLVKSNLRL